jgi:NAD(P)-dependent dehydrogenase (short-subunit alcohol dehydrogenase family)
MSLFPSARLDDKVVVVTGASSGIGLGIARAASEAGAALILVGRDEERLARCARDVGKHKIVSVDLTRDEAPETIVRAALDSFGSLDVLVHSAGIWEPVGFLDSGIDVFDRQWAVNIRAPYALSRAAVPHMPEGSAIVFISSIAGHSGFPNSVAYCATKGAVELLTKALAMELSPRGIRVNCVAPGNIRTAMNAEKLASPEYEAGMIEATPLRRIGVVEDVAPSVVFLASDAARFIQGATLLVDGGWTAQ